MAARGIAQTVRGAIKRPLVDLAIFSAATSILLLIAPIYMLQVYDRVLPTGNFSTLISLSVMATCGLLVLGVIEIVRSYYAARIAARIDVLMGEPIFLATMAGPQASAGDISPLRDLLTIRSLITSRTLFFLFDLPFMPLFLLLLALIHPLICLLTVLGGAVMVVIAIMNQVGTSSLMRASSEAQNRSLTLAQGFGRSFGTIRALGMAGKSTQIWGFAFAEAGIAAGRVTEINAIYGGVARTVRMAIQMATLGLGAYLVLIGQITAGMIFASTMIAGRALQPLDQITGSWRQIADGQLALRRLLGALPKTVASSEPMALPTPQGNLVVSDLVYQLPDAAPGTPPLIKNVSFRLSAGETLSVIGPNRAGKTTLARLLVGALRPQSGTVRIDAINLHDADSDLIGRSIGYLPQDSELFPGTLAQNISRFDVPINAEAVVLAAKAAGAHELILSQHKGYETYAGPGGARLSGGERQRVALARALYGSPSLLVLDEPNANLDAQGDFALERVIAQARSAGRTVIVITHRPALAGKCDKILVLTNGSVSGFGPAKSVLEQMAKQAGQPEPTSNPIKDRQAAIK